MAKTYLVWKEKSINYDFEMKFNEYEDDDRGTHNRDHYYELLMTGDDEKVIVSSVQYSNEHPCLHHAHYKNDAIRAKDGDSEEDPAVWAHCDECHADGWEHYGINGPRCGHSAGCPNC